MENIINIQYILVYKYQNKLLIKTFVKTDNLRKKIKDFILSDNYILPIVYYERTDIIVADSTNILDIFIEKNIEIEEEDIQLIEEENFLNFFSYVKNIYIYENEEKQCKTGLGIQKYFKSIINNQKKKYSNEPNFETMEYK